MSAAVIEGAGDTEGAKGAERDASSDYDRAAAELRRARLAAALAVAEAGPGARGDFARRLTELRRALDALRGVSP